MYARVIPLTKLPRRFDYFDYSVPEEFKTKIKTGHLVVVSFRNKKIYGIVLKIENIEKSGLKPILSLTGKVIPQTLLAHTKFAANYYVSSLPVLLKFIIPLPIKERESEQKYFSQKKLKLHKENVDNVVAALKNFKLGASYFLYDNNLKETLATIIKLSQKNITKGQSVFLLVPAFADINVFASYLLPIFKKKLIISHGKLSAGKKYANWQKISAGGAYFILGTRASVFLPFKNLGISFIYNSTSDDHKQWDQNPRYDARNLIEGDKIFIDVLPRVETFKRMKNGELLALNSKCPRSSFSIVDITKEKKNLSPFSSLALKNMISAGLSQNKKIVLFLNRKDKDSIYICGDCNNVSKCKECNRPLLIDKNHFLCYYCNTKKPIDLRCENCKGNNLKPMVSGLKNIEKILGQEFPNARIESAFRGKKSFTYEWDILITTDYFWKNIFPYLSNAKIYGAGFVDFDFYLIRPEFNQIETATIALERALSFAKNYGLEKFLVQTASPENKIFKNFEEVYASDLMERKELKYPPYSRIVKIICKEHDKEALKLNTDKLYKELQMHEFNPLPPFEPFIKKRTKNFLKHIILKESLERDLNDLRKLIPNEYQIDIDPISIY